MFELQNGFVKPKVLTVIVVEKLEKTYPDLQRGAVCAVRGISFVAAPGQVFGLLGPNGAGKTTVLRMLSTMLKPTGGSATVAGFDVETQAEEVRRQIGFGTVYVKVYSQQKDGGIKFYKDGYTDLRGRFDYASLSTGDLESVAKFSLLISSKNNGSMVREAMPPLR